jgi:hypothetical protein
MREYFAHTCVDQPNLPCPACEFSQQPQTFTVFINGLCAKVTLDHGIVVKAPPGSDLLGKDFEFVYARVRHQSGWCEWEGPEQLPYSLRLRNLWFIAGQSARACRPTAGPPLWFRLLAAIFLGFLMTQIHWPR